MSSTGIKSLFAAVIASLLIISSTYAFSQEEIEYKKFRLDDAYCDVGLRYMKTPQGMTVGVSAIATGKGSEFRNWYISGIKIRMGNARIRPDAESKFYTTKDSMFRVPAAILFAVIGGLADYNANTFPNTISKIGVSLGIGLLALSANGEITGERCVFIIPADMVGNIREGKDYIDVEVKNDNIHEIYSIRIGLMRPREDTEKKFNFQNMSESDLAGRMDLLKSNITALEEEQSSYKYGQDPEYDAIQKKIELSETERGLAYKAWFEKKNGPENVQ